MERIKASLSLLLVVTAGWAMATLALWLHLHDRATLDRHWHQQGQSQLQFPLTDANDLIGSRVLDVQSQRFDADGVHLQFGPGPANLPIGFDGRCLDGQRFSQLLLGTDASAPLTLALVHSPTAGGEQRIAELALPPGPQTLRVNLAALAWHSADPEAGSERNWSEGGGVCEFRLVPVADRQIEIRLANLRFVLAEGEPASAAWADAGSLQILWRRPESVLIERDQRRKHADLELWPEQPPPGEGIEAPLDRRWPGYLGVALASLALLLGASRGSLRWQIWLTLAGPLVLLATNGLGESTLPMAWSALAISAISLAIAFARVDLPPNAHRWLGSARAWGDVGVGVALTLLVAWLIHLGSQQALRSPPQTGDLLRYLVWAALQQTLLQRLLFPALNGSGRGLLHALPAAAAFALMHTPNFSLMLLCLVAGLWWSTHYRRHHSWAPLVAAHTALGALLTTLLPANWLYSAEVGARFLIAP